MRGKSGSRLTGRTADEAIAATDDVSAFDEALREYRRLYGDDECARLTEEFQKAACFPAGTPVAMADGSWRPIESLRIGHAVLSRAEDAPEAAARSASVERVMERMATRLATLAVSTADGERRVVATPEHPVHVRGRGWTELHDLAPGDVLVGGVTGTVVSVSLAELPEPVVVYNFAVSGLHTYHVGMSGGTEPALLWVHNRCEWASLAEEKIRWMYGGPSANRAGMTKADLVKEMIRIRTALDARATKLSSSKSSRLAWRATPDPKVIDAMTDKQALKAINGPGKSKNLRERMLTLWKDPENPSSPPLDIKGTDAHHIIPSTVCEEHAKFLAKIGFDVDNPRNGTLLSSEALKGPREAGRKQVTHADGHPGYILAMTAKLKNLSDEFDGLVDSIPHPAGTPAYAAEYNKVVSDMQVEIHEMQNQCRDALQKGKPLMGKTEDIDKEWRNFLTVVEPGP